MSFSIILPTFNEKGHINNLIKVICKILKKNKLIYEVIVVDDNSNDGTIETIKKTIKKNKFVKLIVRYNKKRNLADSLNEGIKKARYKYLIWMDADFQHPPMYIKNFIKKIKFYDVIIHSRFLKTSFRYSSNKSFKIKSINDNQSIFFNKICKYFFFDNISDYTSGYICLKKNVLKNYKLKGYYGDYFLSLVCHLIKKKKKIFEIPFKDSVRRSGSSKTIDNLNIKYIYLCFRYLICLIANILDIYLWKFLKKFN